jgi:hypothetical protein
MKSCYFLFDGSGLGCTVSSSGLLSIAASDQKLDQISTLINADTSADGVIVLRL